MATDMDTSPKAVMTALQALRKDVTELKRSSLGMDFPHDRKRQKPEASSGTSDPRRGDLASLARRHLSVPTADVKDMELRISEFVRVHGGGHAIKRNGNASQTSLRLKCVAPGCQFKAAAVTRSRVVRTAPTYFIGKHVFRRWHQNDRMYRGVVTSVDVG